MFVSGKTDNKFNIVREMILKWNSLMMTIAMETGYLHKM